MFRIFCILFLFYILIFTYSFETNEEDSKLDSPILSNLPLSAATPLSSVSSSISSQILTSTSSDSSSSVVSSSSLNTSFKYEIVIDSGSTGSRVYIYKYNPDDVFSSLVEVSQKRVTPAITNFLYDQEGLKEQLKELIFFASNSIPRSSVSSTPLSLKATAGVRALKDFEQEILINNIKKAIQDILDENYSIDCEKIEENEEVKEYLEKKTCVNFIYDKSETRIISGGEEALYGLLASNLSDQTKSVWDFTLGAADLGGSSKQIAFIMGIRDNQQGSSSSSSSTPTPSSPSISNNQSIFGMKSSDSSYTFDVNSKGIQSFLPKNFPFSLSSLLKFFKLDTFDWSSNQHPSSISSLCTPDFRLNLPDHDYSFEIFAKSLSGMGLVAAKDHIIMGLTKKFLKGGNIPYCVDIDENIVNEKVENIDEKVKKMDESIMKNEKIQQFVQLGFTFSEIDGSMGLEVLSSHLNNKDGEIILEENKEKSSNHHHVCLVPHKTLEDEDEDDEFFFELEIDDKEIINDENSSSVSIKIVNPCAPPGEPFPYPPPFNHLPWVGTGNFSQCTQLIKQLLLDKKALEISKCMTASSGSSSLFGSSSQSPTLSPSSSEFRLPSTIIAMDNFPKVMEVLGLSEFDTVSPRQIRQQAEKICKISWDELLASFPDGFHDYRAQKACFGSSYIYSILTYIYGMKEDDLTRFKPMEAHEKYTIGWPLGVALSNALKWKFETL